MILEHPMTRRFCERRVMSEYHTRKPYFNASDDLYTSCNHSCSTPCEEMWKKFKLYLTPPSSPPRENEDPELELGSVCTDANLTSGLDFDDLDLKSPDFALVMQEDVTYPEKHPRDCSSEQKLIKDCMWNGVGHRASAALKKAHSRRSSPASHSPCHANGCVDPRNIFPYPVGQPTSCDRRRTLPGVSSATQKYHRTAVDGAETPSDSEEEIDVVTVEKGQNNSILKVKNGLNSRQKIVATFLPKENGKLAIVTTSNASFATKGLKSIQENGDQERGRARCKYPIFTTGGQPARTVAMAIENHSLEDLQMATANPALKRRHTVEESCFVAKETVAKQQFMQMANPKLVMQRSDSVSPVARCDDRKRRILSLDGVSFCANTGVRQNTNGLKETQKIATVDVPNCKLETSEMTLNSATSRFKVTTKPKMLVSAIKMEDEDDQVGSLAQRSPPNKRKRKAEALVRLMSSGSGSDSEQIRAAHNVLERQRREGLRTSFHTLRDNVPELKKMDKTPKVNILNKARDYCIELQNLEKSQIAEKERLTRRNQRLQERLKRAKKALLLLRPRDDGVESDAEDSGDSPVSSLPPSPPVFAPSGYYIPTRTQEVVFRLEAAPSSREARKRIHEYVTPYKQGKCHNRQMRPIYASLHKLPETNFRAAAQESDALSDGFECLDSEEEALETM